MAKILEIRNSTAEFLTFFLAQNKEDGGGRLCIWMKQSEQHK